MSSVQPIASKPTERGSTAAVRALPFQGDQAALVKAVLKGHPGAAAALHDRYARRMHGLLYRILGPDVELEDALQEAFVRALESLRNLRDPTALDSWMMGVAVRTARTLLQRRSRRSWLKIMSNEDLPEPTAPAPDPGHAEALRCTYQLLGRMAVDDRMALVLRFASGMTLTETAEACEVSLATIKRRLNRAEKAFQRMADTEPALRDWLEEVES
jgi:RNA polymerase sigma-70 factor (ECF subfamily)